MFVFAALRPPVVAWREQSLLAAVVFVGLPALNAVTTSHHLLRSLADRDLVMAGFDLTTLAMGGMFVGMAWAASRRPLPRAAR